MIENRMMTGNRVDCLYRVSTDKQVDYNDKSQADIPMQRRECHLSLIHIWIASRSILEQTRLSASLQSGFFSEEM